MLRNRSLLAAIAAAGWLSTAAFAQINVGVVYGGTMTGPEAVAQLNDDTYFDFNAEGLGAAEADTLEELMAYDVVVLGESGTRTSGYTPEMFAAMRQYLTAGGGIVTVGWYDYGTDPYMGQQAADADFIAPFADGPYAFTSGRPTIRILANHEITNEIADFQISPSLTEWARALDPEATLLGEVASQPGSVAIAYQDEVGRSAYLGGLYLAQASYGNSGVRSGVEDQLLEQAVAWAAGGGGGGCEPCDANCDGVVDAFDIEPFIAILTGGGPGCSSCAADANQDGVVDAFDIEPFIACLTGP